MSAFIDSNVLLYTEDADAPEKCRLAKELLRAAFAEPAGVISTQVLQEFYVNATRKLGVSKAAARERVLLFARLKVVPISSQLVIAATDLHQLQPISFWDALVVRAAAAAGCSILYTEDLQHGAVYDGVQVVNPFRDVV